MHIESTIKTMKLKKDFTLSIKKSLPNLFEKN